MVPRIAGPKANAGGRKKSRKELRKDSKEFKKLRNVAFSQRKSLDALISQKFGPSEEEKKKKKKKAKKKKNKKEGEAAISTVKTAFSEGGDDELEKLKKQMDREHRRRERAMAEKEEAEAAKYARKLGYDKRKSGTIPKALVDDGLDYLLEVCDAAKRKSVAEEDSRLEGKEKRVKKRKKDDDDDMNSELGDEEEMDLDDKDEMSQEGGSEDGEELEVDLEGEDEEEEEESDREAGEGRDAEGKGKKKKDEGKAEIGEDIYGRTINRRTGELIDFDPRAAHAKLAELEASSVDDEERRKIERSINGIINRLSEATLVKSVRTIEEIFHGNSKNEVKSAFSRTLLKHLSSPFRLQEQLLASLASLTALLHATISSEISSHVVEVFFVEFVKRLDEGEGEEDGKAMENSALFASHLLSFKVIRGDVLIELLHKLREKLTQRRLGLILLVINYSYRALKRSVNTQMIDFISAITQQLSAPEYQNNLRMRFLAEELAGVRKATGVEQPALDHLLAVHHGLVKKNTSVEKVLGMSLADLLAAEERGRWWIVGSAFRLPSDTAGTLAAGPSVPGKKQLTFDADILELAKRAGMNTEVRRNVFCSVVTAMDEDSAFERVLRLSLCGSQEREIIHILVTMTLKEKPFNPFYAALLRRFADHHKRFILTIQYALWDRLRDIEKLKEEQRNRLASLLAELLLHRTLPLTVLKVIEWGELSPAHIDFLKKIFEQLVSVNNINKLTKIFACVLDGKKNRLLTDGIRLFLQMHLPENDACNKVENMFSTYH